MTLRCLFILFIGSLWPWTPASSGDFIPPNKKWVCTGCNIVTSKKEAIFAMLRRAMHFESREIYLNFDNKWVDKALDAGSGLSVRVVDWKDLGDTQLPSRPRKVSGDQTEERYEAIVSFAPTRGGNHSSDNDIGVTVDQFLARNPCFIPLKDPLSSKSEGDYDHAAIFLKLPSRPFEPTCRLYELITSQQFVSQCPTEDKKYHVNWLGNIGWTNCVHLLLYTFMSALHNSKIFLAPRAMENGAEAKYEIAVKGEKIKLSHTWGAWSDRDSCPPENYAWNPWSCHFITLSNCHNLENRRLVYDPSVWTLPDPPKSESNYLSIKAEIESTRKIFEDGIRLTESEWEKHRLIAFIMRPNYGMRNRLRRTMNNLVHLHATGLTAAAAATAAAASATATASSVSNTTEAIEITSSHRALAMSSGTHRSERRRSNAGRTLEPCIGLHIRHGDAMTDHRGRSNLDRSLGAHVSCVKTFAAALGASNIFLATDNVTLFTAAPKEFPEYGWYAQRRALRKYEHNQADSHHHERSKQQEVANMLVDMIVMSRCEGMVGSFDGGFTAFLRQIQCNRGASGCKPSRNLYHCQPGAKQMRP